jgi:alginate O-acetyltransferase complex protein AlgI
MLFNSFQFLIFFPVVTLIYFLLPHRFRWLHLLIASCIFYMAFIPIYIIILFFTIIIDYIAGIAIENAQGSKRKVFLMLSIFANVGVLAFFKYFNFFSENVNALLTFLHCTVYAVPLLSIILPIGLSFHTFQAMSYTIEVYRGHQRAERHFGIYALYVMFYPQLVAGPIERPQNLLHQFKEEHTFSSQNLLDGLRLMLWGFFKKLVIADRLALYVNVVYNRPDEFHYLNLILATLFFTIQIYCDFSGYSDIAIGTARAMGFDLMINFNRPYFSKNIQEFWKRWHISLSTWFRDYVYISLGGNRAGIKRVYFNTAVVFLLSGFWHGANWTFIIWGGLHTIYILAYMAIKRYGKWKLPDSIIIDFMGWFLTFILVSFAWIFFRANTVQDAFTIIKHIFILYHKEPYQVVVVNALDQFKVVRFTLFIGALMTIFMFISERLFSVYMNNLNKKPLWDVAYFTVVLIVVVLLGVFHNNSFIYFQF